MEQQFYIERTRLKWLSRDDSRKYFETLKEELKCETFRELSEKLGMPESRIKLWRQGKRSLPISFIKQVERKYKIKLEGTHEIVDVKELLLEKSKEGLELLKKFDPRITGKQGMSELRKRLEIDKELYRKWRVSIKQSLQKKFGLDCYKELGQKGGITSIQKISKEELQKKLEKAFRKSFKSRLVYKDMRFRSSKEIEVAKLLDSLKIKYEYEPRILQFYPDFLLEGSKMLIEVFGFEWFPHIKRMKEKIKRFSESEFDVVLFTYPSLVKYFESEQIPVITDIKQLTKIISGRYSGMVSSSGS